MIQLNIWTLLIKPLLVEPFLSEPCCILNDSTEDLNTVDKDIPC